MLQHSKPGAKHPPLAPDLELRTREDTLWEKAVSDWNHEMAMINVPNKIMPKNKGVARAGTLVICPMIALSQWKTEIENFTEPGALTVGVYHGPTRATDVPAAMMQKYDVVLTTYQVLEQDYRKMVSPNKIACPNCGGKFKVDKLRVHLKYFCGDGARKTEAQARQRRTGDRGPANNGNGGGGGGNKKGKGKTMSKKKPPMPTTGTKKKFATAKTIRMKGTSDCESESDLSVAADIQDAVLSPQRPSRTASRTARKKLSASINAWSEHALDANDDDDDDDDESSFSSDGTSSVDSNVMLSDLAKRRTTAVSSKGANKKRVDDRSDNDLLQRARKKQMDAMAHAKMNKAVKGKGKQPTKKSFGGKPKLKKVPMKKGKAPMGDDDDDDDDGDSSSSSENEFVDPMEGIDLDELMDEAMAGSKRSVLHSFCWWRVVLDEAHYIKVRSLLVCDANVPNDVLLSLCSAFL